MNNLPGSERLESDQLAAMKRAEMIAESIEESFVGQIIQHYRTGKTLDEIAALMGADISEDTRSHGVMRSAIHIILKNNLPPNEQENLRNEHRSNNFTFAARSTGGKRRRQIHGPLNFPDSARPRAAAARGLIWWEPEWNAELIVLAHDPAYRKNVLHLDCQKIANRLNALFSINPPLTGKNCSRQINAIRGRLRAQWKSVEDKS